MGGVQATTRRGMIGRGGGSPGCSLVPLASALLLALQAAVGVAQDLPGIPDLSESQWREDVRFFADTLTSCHKNPYHSVPKEAFQRAVAALEERLPTLQDYEIVVGIQRLAAMIGDGHTFLSTWDLYRSFPIELFWFGNELRVIRTVPAYRRALGTKVLCIGRHDVADVHRRVQQLIPQAENEWYALHQSAQHITRAEALAALGILPEPDGSAPFAFEDGAGRRFTLELSPVAPGTPMEWADAVARKPLSAQAPEEGFWFAYLPEEQTVYVNFRRYDDLADQARRLLAMLEERSPKRLIIDLRQNGGGNYTVARQHLIYKLQMIPSLNRPGGLYVITGRGTFSAAMTNATDFRRETDAILVGEPTSARPNGYQELGQFILPNSKLRATCALLHYRFQDGDGPAVIPDKRIDPDWASYSAGRDPALDWILAQPLPQRQMRRR